MKEKKKESEPVEEKVQNEKVNKKDKNKKGKKNQVKKEINKFNLLEQDDEENENVIEDKTSIQNINEEEQKIKAEGDSVKGN